MSPRQWVIKRACSLRSLVAFRDKAKKKKHCRTTKLNMEPEVLKWLFASGFSSTNWHSRAGSMPLFQNQYRSNNKNSEYLPISIRYNTGFLNRCIMSISRCVDLLITLLCFTHNLLNIDNFTVKKNIYKYIYAVKLNTFILNVLHSNDAAPYNRWDEQRLLIIFHCAKIL